MKILITGGNGFIARNFFETFKERYCIYNPNRTELDLLNINKVESYIKSNKFDVVIHTATHDAASVNSQKDPKLVLENNLRMFFNIIQYRNHFGKLINLGSGSEYGRQRWMKNMSESYSENYIPIDSYGFSKYIMSKYIQNLKNSVHLRLFSVFGKYDDYTTRYISNACIHQLKGVPIKIDKNRYYDFMIVDDLVRIIDWFLNNGNKNQIYNVCTGKTISFIEIANIIGKISEKPVSYIVDDQNNIVNYGGDNTLLLNETGPFRFMPIETGIKKIYDYIRSNKLY